MVRFLQGYVRTWSHTLNNVLFLVSNMSKDHGRLITHKLRNSTHTGKVIVFCIQHYHYMRVYHKYHRLQSSGWTAHLRVTEHISTIIWHQYIHITFVLIPMYCQPGVITNLPIYQYCIVIFRELIRWSASSLLKYFTPKSYTHRQKQILLGVPIIQLWMVPGNSCEDPRDK